VKNILIDTNVVLDYLLHRLDYPNAMNIYLLAEQKFIKGYISVSAITDIFFLAKGALGEKPTKEALKHLMNIYYPRALRENRKNNKEAKNKEKRTKNKNWKIAHNSKTSLCLFPLLSVLYSLASLHVKMGIYFLKL